MDEQTIICPSCGTRIPISKALTSQIEASLRKSFEANAEKQEKEVRAAFQQQLVAESARLEKQARIKADKAASAELSQMRRDLVKAQQLEKSVRASFERKLAQETLRLQKQARRDVQAETSAKMGVLQRQLREKNKQVAEVQKLRSQLSAREKNIETEIARKVDKASRRAEQETTSKIEAQFHTHQLELEKKLSDAKLQASELKRKLEQSSQQTQGEVIELELEKALKKAFPNDKIEPISKGKAGADVLQKVYTSTGQHCGTIIWESKNTRNWSKSWLGKLRSDQRRAKAEIAVLVSVVLPSEILHFAQVDGVWVTEFPLTVGLATALRANLIQVFVLRQSTKGKNEKMESLYEYLSGTEFKQRVEAIVEGFRSMQDDLDKERRTMENLWAKREKQLQLVITNVSGMYGDMRAIVGQSLPKIRRLELPIAT
jgi:hypothetical protein